MSWGALTAIALALMAVFVTAARGGMYAADPGDTFAFTIGLGLGAGVIVLALPVTVLLILAGLYWLAMRVSQNNTTFLGALFNWPVAVIVIIVAILLVR